MAGSARRRTIARWTIVALATLFALLQVRQPDRTNPAVISEIDAPAEVAKILERACYDCHSNETDWPWYGYVAPVSWWLVDHVEHGRRDLNFSEWPLFDFEAIEHALADIDEQIEHDEMPLKSYRIMHRGARLTDEEKRVLRAWARPER